MRKCMNCGKLNVKNPDHDLCYTCFKKREKADNSLKTEEKFKDNLDSLHIHTVYVMFYGKDNCKIGYTDDLNSRILEIKRTYPNNQLMYFREFSDETSARRFEAWLKKLSKRSLNRFISTFQDKIKKVHRIE